MPILSNFWLGFHKSAAASGPTGIEATGGTKTYSGDQTIHTFTATGLSLIHI